MKGSLFMHIFSSLHSKSVCSGKRQNLQTNRKEENVSYYLILSSQYLHFQAVVIDFYFCKITLFKRDNARGGETGMGGEIGRGREGARERVREKESSTLFSYTSLFKFPKQAEVEQVKSRNQELHSLLLGIRKPTFFNIISALQECTLSGRLKKWELTLRALWCVTFPTVC